MLLVPRARAGERAGNRRWGSVEAVLMPFKGQDRGAKEREDPSRSHMDGSSMGREDESVEGEWGERDCDGGEKGHPMREVLIHC